MNKDMKLQNHIQEAILLGWFKTFCDRNASHTMQQRLRNIYSNSTDFIMTTKNIFINIGFSDISDDDAIRLYELIRAFLTKNSYRKNIPDSTKLQLLIMQKGKCAICDNAIDFHDHLDHIVPFKYVGDELENNYQLLCSNCNFKKNASIDFQIRYLLKTL